MNYYSHIWNGASSTLNILEQRYLADWITLTNRSQWTASFNSHCFMPFLPQLWWPLSQGTLLHLTGCSSDSMHLQSRWNSHGVDRSRIGTHCQAFTFHHSFLPPGTCISSDLCPPTIFPPAEIQSGDQQTSCHLHLITLEEPNGYRLVTYHALQHTKTLFSGSREQQLTSWRKKILNHNECVSDKVAEKLVAEAQYLLQKVKYFILQITWKK